MPADTAPWLASTRQTIGGGAGGRAWYSGGATNSTTPGVSGGGSGQSRELGVGATGVTIQAPRDGRPTAAELRALGVVATVAVLVELAEALAWGRVDHATQVALEGATAVEEGEERVDVGAAAKAPDRARVSVVHHGHGALLQRHVGQPGVENREIGDFGLA
eukprot:scaffold120241_cov90-Phaeocystis_antarctica.AAC.4